MSTKPSWSASDYWMIAAAVVLPLGWILPLCKFAWARVGSKRLARRDEPPS